jgi:hypothetical protein
MLASSLSLSVNIIVANMSETHNSPGEGKEFRKISSSKS